MGPGPGAACAITLNSALTPGQQRLYQDPLVIQRLLRDARTIAVVGLSTDPQRASWFVASYLKHEGYRVIPVNPKADRILGERAYPDLASIPEPVDLVDVFRPAAECLAIAQQAVAIRAKALWLQLRLVSLGPPSSPRATAWMSWSTAASRWSTAATAAGCTGRA